MPAADSTATTGCWGSRWLSAEVRRAANTAMDMIDAMQAELYLLRARLVSEIRASDDQAAVRVDDLLARCGEVATENHQVRQMPHLVTACKEEPR